MVLISFIDGSDALDSRQEEAVAKSNLTHNYFVRRETLLVAVPEQLVFSRIYPSGIEDLPRPEAYIEAHPGEIDDVDYSLTDQVREPN